MDAKELLSQKEQTLAQLMDERLLSKGNKRVKLTHEINSLRTSVAEIKDFLNLKEGQWVKNGRPEPGKILQLKMANKVPEVWVQYEGENISIPERPSKLTVIDYEPLPELPQRTIEQDEAINSFFRRCSETKTLLISQIQKDVSTQQRIEINQEVVEEYSTAMEQGAKFPPVKVRFDGENYWLYDGFHTITASLKIGKTEIKAEITEGTKREAILDSVGVNANHGLRRTNADKRKAVMTLLDDEEWKMWSNLKIAKHCNVSESFVRKIKKELNIETDEVFYQDKHGHFSKMSKGNLRTNGHIAQNEVTICTNDHIAQNEVTICTNDLTGYLASENLETYRDKHDNVTVKVEDEVVEEDNQVLKELKEPKSSSVNFKEEQLVQLNLSSLQGASEKLRFCNHQYGIIKSFTEAGKINLFINGDSFVVFPYDLKPVELVPMTISFTPEQFCYLLNLHKTKFNIETEIKNRILKG